MVLPPLLRASYPYLHDASGAGLHHCMQACHAWVVTAPGALVVTACVPAMGNQEPVDCGRMATA